VAAEFVFQRLRGAPIAVLLSLGPVPQEWGRGHGVERRSGVRTRVVGVVTDVTERHEAARWRERLHQRLMVAADEERRRIARELHDETGQSLTALLVGLRSLADAPTLKNARMSALRLRELAARTLDDVGRLARGLHPSVLDELGLVPAATRHVEEFARTFGLAVTLRTKGVEEYAMPLPLATAVYRLLQEALTNVARHAQANSVRIALRADSGRIALEVRDDGIGFDPDRALDSGVVQKDGDAHIGLLSMRERTALFGGTLEVRSVPGRGTTIIARLPLGESAPRNGRRARAAR
jgi:signal transduction histidine kinase